MMPTTLPRQRDLNRSHNWSSTSLQSHSALRGDNVALVQNDFYLRAASFYFSDPSLELQLEQRFQREVLAELTRERARMIDDWLVLLVRRLPFTPSKQRRALARRLDSLNAAFSCLADAERIAAIEELSAGCVEVRRSLPQKLFRFSDDGCNGVQLPCKCEQVGGVTLLQNLAYGRKPSAGMR